MNRRKVLSMLVLAAAITLTGQIGSIPVAQAQDNHTTERFTEPYEEIVPAAFTCSGEAVHIFGFLDLVAQTTTNSNGGVHAVFHITPHLTVIGLTSGLTYRTAGPFQTVTNTNGNDQFNFQLVNTIVLISPGSLDNLVLHETVHATVNANGVTTVDFDKFRAECRG